MLEWGDKAPAGSAEGERQGGRTLFAWTGAPPSRWALVGSVWWGLLLGAACFLLVGASAMFTLYPTWRSLPRLLASGRKPLGRAPTVHLFIPIRGADPYLEGNLRSFLVQAYAAYRIIALTDSSDDPAGEVLRKLKREFPRLTWEICGRAVGTAGKTHALLVGLARHPDAEVYAFADADGRVSPHWLNAMLAPLEEQDVGATTSYRICVPVGIERGGETHAAWNLTTLPAVVYSDIPWGGAMAITRRLFEEAGTRERWAHTIADDCELREAVLAKGKRIHFVPEGLSMSPTDAAFRNVLEWAGRQLTILRVFRKRVYAVGLTGALLSLGLVIAGLVLFAAGAASQDWSLLVVGAFLLLPLLATAFHLRWLLRIWERRLLPLFADLRPAETALPSRLLRRFLSVQLVGWYALLKPLFGATIRWRGRTYRIHASRKVEILE